MTPEQDGHPFQDHKRPRRNLAEWVTLSIAVLILAVVAGLVVYGWVNKRNQPPILEINRSGTIRETNGTFYVPFEVTNTGGETAEAVQVVAELRVNGTVEESGDLSIEFLSQNEKEEGTFIFSRNPQQGELRLRVSGYRLP